MATHSSILAWRISRTGEPSVTVHGVAKSGTRLSDQHTHTHTHTHTEGTKILQIMHHGQKNKKRFQPGPGILGICESHKEYPPNYSVISLQKSVFYF